MDTIRMAMVLAMAATVMGCAAAAPMHASLEPMPVQKESAVLTQNHFKSDRTGNLSEEQLREILESPVFLEEDTRRLDTAPPEGGAGHVNDLLRSSSAVGMTTHAVGHDDQVLAATTRFQDCDAVLLLSASPNILGCCDRPGHFSTLPIVPGRKRPARPPGSLHCRKYA